MQLKDAEKAGRLSGSLIQTVPDFWFWKEYRLIMKELDNNKGIKKEMNTLHGDQECSGIAPKHIRWRWLRRRRSPRDGPGGGLQSTLSASANTPWQHSISLHDLPALGRSDRPWPLLGGPALKWSLMLSRVESFLSDQIRIPRLSDATSPSMMADCLYSLYCI